MSILFSFRKVLAAFKPVFLKSEKKKKKTEVKYLTQVFRFRFP